MFLVDLAVVLIINCCLGWLNIYSMLYSCCRLLVDPETSVSWQCEVVYIALVTNTAIGECWPKFISFLWSADSFHEKNHN